MHIVLVLAFIGILSMHLALSNLIWRNPIIRHALLDAAKLSLFTTAVMVSVGFVILPIINAFATNPFQALGNFLSGTAPEDFEGRMFHLTFGLPTIFSTYASCLFLPLLPLALFGLSLLPLLARRGYGSFSFWVTILGLGYMAFFFAAAGVINILAEGIIWFAIWALFGAIVSFLLKLAQLMAHRKPGHATPSMLLPTLGWIGAGTTATLFGLLLGVAKAGIATTERFGPAFPEATPALFQTLLAGLFLSAIMSLIAFHFMTGPIENKADQPSIP